jgi:serine/threonine-protein kinase
MLSPTGSAELHERARAAVDRALAVGPQLGWTHLARGYLLLHSADPVGAVAAFCDALARAPSLADAHGMLGGMLTEMGRIPEARKRRATALRLDPTILGVASEEPRGAALVGRWDVVDSHLADPAQRPTSPAGWVQPVRMLSYRGEINRLRAIEAPFEATPRDKFGTYEIVRAILDVYLGQGPVERVYKALHLDLAKISSSRRASIGLQMRAEVAGFAGDAEVGFDALERADQVGLIDLLWMERCPHLDSLRSSPRFADVHGRVRERAYTAYDAMWL